MHSHIMARYREALCSLAEAVQAGACGAIYTNFPGRVDLCDYPSAFAFVDSKWMVNCQ